MGTIIIIIFLQNQQSNKITKIISSSVSQQKASQLIIGSHIIIFKFIMIRDQNYVKVAEYTQKAFQVFAKRVLASRILSILETCKSKKQVNPSESQILLQTDSISKQFSLEQKNASDQIDLGSKNTRFNKQQNILHGEAMTMITRIGSLKYGEFIFLDLKNKEDQCRLCSVLDSLNMFNSRDSLQNVVNMKRSCFQICSPTVSMKQNAEGEEITNSSLVCLKNVFTGQYIHLTGEMCNNQFGYYAKLKPLIDKQAIFQFGQAKDAKKVIFTDELVSIASYSRPDLNLAASKQHLDQKVDYTIIGSFKSFFFNISKMQQVNNIRSNPYYLIHCVDIHKNLSAQQPSFRKFVTKKEFNKIEYQTENQAIEKEIPQQTKMWKIFSITSARVQTETTIEDMKSESLCQIWEIQRIGEGDQGEQCLIKNVICDQPLRPKQGDYPEVNTFIQKSSLFHFQLKDNNQYTILNDQNINLTAFYDSQTQRYQLKYDHQKTYETETMMGKGHGYRFELIQLQPTKCKLIYELIQMNEILKCNYGFIEKWGFRYEERDFKLKYLISQLKSKLNLVRCKIGQVGNVIERLKQILLRQQNNLYNTQLMIKQFKILEILIFYSRIIKLKIGSEADSDKSAEKLACQQLKQLLLKIFDIIYYLIFNNKITSQIIIENSKFFSFLLLQHPEPIGLIIEESIRNLCILSTKTVVEEDEIFKWTNWIEPLNKVSVHIQKKYIDIIAEVVVDPNDIGILSYQNKIKQLLLSHRSKKKIIPRFGIRTGKDQTQQPIIIFQYDKFPITFEDITNTSSTKFQLRCLYRHNKTIEQYAAYEGYICSFIKLMRNLCKDRNKKLAKIIQDYGLSQTYLNLVFRNNEIGWQLIAKFLSLYCSIHIVQDPFLSFQKRSVKCFSWSKIDKFDFTIKTSILFSQFTEQSVAQEKLKVFDTNIIVLLDRYFDNLENGKQNEDCLKGDSFVVMVSVLYEIVNYGYLSYMLIQKYVKTILNYVNLYLKKESKNERQENLILKIMKLISLAQEIWTTIQGMSLLKTIYNNLCLSKNSSIHYLVQIKRKALNHDEGSLGILKRSPSSALHSSRSSRSIRFDETVTDSAHPIDVSIIQFALARIIQNKLAVNSPCFQQLMNLLQLISQRGQRISSFLNQIFILNSQQQQNLYLEYSGITPMGVVGDSSSSSRRLQNVMKVKELVDKITIQHGQRQDEPRKRQKILQLNNLLIKIVNNLTHLKEKHYELFKTCQLLLQKLKLHQILIQIMKYYDRDEYQQLIANIITFYIQFIHNNAQNLSVMAAFFCEFTKRYSYKMLPDLLPSLFTKTQNQEDAFWLVYRNLDKKMDSKHREIVLQCIYRMAKVCPPSIFQNIKGQIIYTLASNSQFSSYINGQVCSPSFICLVCLVGSPFMIERMSSILKKSDLLERLKDSKQSYFRKWIYLKLYHYLYIQQKDSIDQIQLQFIVSEIIIGELKRLPASCQNRASLKLTELKQDGSMLSQQKQSALNIEAQYRNLVIDGSAKIETSEQQLYFIYLLDINNETELSLLTFLQDLLAKYQISDIEPLANYLFKIIHFMEQIFKKQEQKFQSRILNKLYEISVIIHEKYNLNSSSFQNLTFQSAYKIQSFFRRLSEIVVKQNISYFELLRCAGVTPSQVQSRMAQNRVEELIIQTDFAQFMTQLSQFVNNRSEYKAFASQSTIKQFYMLFKQKGALKLNIVHFISKLIQVLDYDKSINLVNTFSVLQKNQQLQKQTGADELKWKRINSELLKMQIKQLRNSFQMHLKDYMSNRICNIMQNIIQAINDTNSTQGNNYQNILQIHQQSYKYSIMNLVASQIIVHFPLSKAINNVELHDWQLYFKFIARYIETYPQEKIFDVLDSIYHLLHQNNQLFSIFANFFITLILQIYSLIKVSEQSRSINTYNFCKRAYSLLSKILSNESLVQSVSEKIQIVITQTFIDSFSQYIASKSIFWFNISQLLLQQMVEGFDKCTEMVRILSDSSSFINNLLCLINALINADLMNTNIQSQNSKKIGNQLLKLIKKININGYQTQLSNIIAGFPYCLIYDRVKESYNFIKKIRQINGFCDHHDKCSQQFCNQVKATQYDESIVNLIINLLIIMHVAACLVNNPVFESQCLGSHMQMLIILHKWKTGTIKSEQDIKYFGFVNIVKSIEVYIFNQKRTIYYNVPFLDKFHNLRIEEQIQQDLSILARQNFFQNLYLLSIQTELKLDDYFSQLYITKLVNLHYACILYLCLICINQIQQIIYIPIGVLYAINTIIIIMKIGIFIVDLKRFMHSYKIVNKIQFIEYTRVKKYSRLILSFSILISYGLQNGFSFLYPITFCLQISKIIVIEEIIIIFLKSTAVIFYPLLFCQSFILVCSYFIYQRVQNYSLISVFLTLEKQIMLYNSIFIDLDQPSQFIMLKSIPELTTLFYMLLVTLQAIFMAKVLIEFGKLTTRTFSGNKICKICGRSKDYFESKGINFNHHRQYQHNVWNYIQYFISIRRKVYLQIQDKQIKNNIDKQDFRFLKIDYHL